MEEEPTAAAPPPSSAPSPPPPTSAVAGAASDDADMASGIPAGALNAFFVCPQCRGYFRDPHVATCCLSTFCRDCVARVLRTAASACPGCGQYMGVTFPQRTRPDPQLQAVMLKLLPDIFERERAREAAFWRDRAVQGEEQAFFPEPPKDRPENGPITSSAFAVATAKWLPPEDGAAAARRQQQQQQQEQRKGGSPLSLAVLDDEEEAATQPSTPLHADIFVHCTPQPPEAEEEDGAGQGQCRRLPALPLPYLRLQRRTQVGQLHKVLVGALGLEEQGPEGLEILCQGEVLTAQHSLHFVERTRWRDRKLAPPLRLHYRWRR